MLMNKLNKKGHNISIQFIIVHKVNKVAHSHDVSVKKAKTVIIHTDKERRFIADLHKSYYERSNPIYGVFDDEKNTIRPLLDTYIQDTDFFNFSLKSVDQYKGIIQSSDPATGGYLVICEYRNEDSGNSYLLVLTTQNKEGFTINDDLIIESIESIDMSKIDVACLINLTKYKKVKDVPENSDTYLSFVRGNKDITFYFMSFIGCKDKSTAKESSNTLLKAIDSYFDNKHLESDQRRLRREEIYSYCQTCMSNKEAILLDVISQMLNPDEPTDFKCYASESYGVSATISGSREVLKKLTSIYYKDKMMVLGFERRLINEKKVIYKEDKKELIIKAVPEELAKQILNQ